MTKYDHTNENVFEASGISSLDAQKEMIKYVIDFMDNVFDEMVITQPISKMAEKIEEILSKKISDTNPLSHTANACMLALIIRYLMVSCIKASKDMWDEKAIDCEMNKAFKALRTGSPNDIDS